MGYLLIVANTPSDNTQKIADAVFRGANSSEYPAKKMRPLEAGAEDVLAASGIIIGTTENFGYMSGQIKDFFERIYYPCLEKKQGMPWALYVVAGLDGTGATNSVEKIVTGLKWRQVQERLLFKGEYNDCFQQQAEELGAGMSVGLEAKIF